MSDSKEVPNDVDGASCPSRCYAALHIAFEVPGNASDDIKLITILGESLEMFRHLPPGHLRAALKWFAEYSEAKIEEYQKPVKSSA